jgi:hypothetical protein
VSCEYAVETMEALGRAGLTVSVCFGPSGNAGCLWSVTVLSGTCEEFDRPYAATSFDHAVEIAKIESIARGWLT